MNIIILVSHGKLAKGMKDTAEMIVGPREDVYAFSAYEQSDEDTFCQAIEQLIDEHKASGRVVIVTDVFGGSVNNEMMTMMQKESAVSVIAGMNLPLVIELIMEPESEIDKLIATGRNGIINCNALLQKERGKEDDQICTNRSSFASRTSCFFME